MLLQRLKQYADTRMDLPPQLYSETAVRYIIELTAEGRFVGLIDTLDPSNSKAKRGQTFWMPQITRTSGITPLLITDKPDYVLGLGKENAKPERVQKAHSAYRELLARCAAATEAPEVQAVLSFFDDDRPNIQLPDDFDVSGVSGLITFRVDGIFPTDLPTVQAFWASEHTTDSDQAILMQCVVCGQQRPVLRSLQGTIKGIPGGQSSGTALISANAKAFESYGLENSLIAPTCADCGERFTKALNTLLASERHRIIINNAIFIAWTRKEVGFDFTGSLNQPDPQQAKALREAVRNGKWQPGVDDIAFYAATLSASGARVVVRDWLDISVKEVKRSVARWFQLQAITDEYGEPAAPRRAEQNVTRQRAALIKLVLLSRSSDVQEDDMVELDLENPNPAYHCGRLLAVLAEIQRNAIGKAAIVDRFYGTASSAPVAVFGRLVRGAQPHLSKLERDRPGVARALQQRMEDVMSTLVAFPTTLTLEEQGLFALGFYHQRAYDRAQMQAAAARKRANTADDSGATFDTDERDLV